MPTAKSQPLRKCLGCNEMKDKRSLLRIVRDKDGNVFFDSTGKAADIIDRLRMQNAFVSSKNLGIPTQKIMEISHEKGARLGILIRELCVAVINGECENSEAGLEEYLQSHSTIQE